MKKEPKSFLVINPFGIGDVLFASPLIRNLNQNFPEAEIYFLCNKRTDTILRSHPLITQTFVYERDEFEARRGWAWFAGYRDFLLEIRRKKIDVAIDLSLNAKFGFFAWVAGISTRIGLNFKKRGRFLTKKIKITGFSEEHVVRHYLKVLELLEIPVRPNKLEIYSTQNNRDWIQGYFRDHNVSPQDLLIGIAPCGGEAFGPNAFMKRWPPEKFVALINQILEKYPAKILLFAGPKESSEIEALLREVQDPNRCFEFTQATIDQLIAVVETIQLFIGNDTGPLRFADAFDKKIIAFFGPVDEQVYGTYPYLPDRHLFFKRDLECRPCYQNFRLPPCPYNIQCLQDIPVEEVFLGVEKLLSNETSV